MDTTRRDLILQRWNMIQYDLLPELRNDISTLTPKPNHQNCSRISLKPALHASLLWKLQFIYTDETFLSSILFAQGDQPVVFECGNEVPLLVRDEREVLFCGEPVILWGTSR